MMGTLFSTLILFIGSSMRNGGSINYCCCLAKPKSPSKIWKIQEFIHPPYTGV